MWGHRPRGRLVCYLVWTLRPQDTRDSHALEGRVAAVSPFCRCSLWALSQPQLGARFLPAPGPLGCACKAGRAGEPQPPTGQVVSLSGPGSRPRHVGTRSGLVVPVRTVTRFSASRCCRAVSAFRFAALGTGVSTCRVTQPRTVSWHWHAWRCRPGGSCWLSQGSDTEPE